MFQLTTFDMGNGPVVGLRQGENYFNSATFGSMREILDNWDIALGKLTTASQRMAARTPVSGVRLLPPLPEPRNIYFTGANYTDHVEEMSRTLGLSLQTDPRASGIAPWFNLKSTTSVVGHGASVRIPGPDARLDWEVELAVVIGRTACSVSVADALQHVAGYTVANDLSARARMMRPHEAESSPFRFDWLGHKSFDGSCPLGPAITPAVMVRDVQDLRVKLWVNDELMQDSTTRNMIYSVADLVAHLSREVTLRPGDVILTGTPAGVGAARQEFLRPGDRVRQWIEEIGEFEFKIE